MKNRILLVGGAVIILVGAAFVASRYLVSRLDGMGPGIVPATSTPDRLPTADRSGWRTYASSTAGVQFQFPPELKLSEEKAATGWRVGSVDPGTVIATVALPENSQPNTNLSEAHLRIGMSRNSKAVAECLVPGMRGDQAFKGTPVTVNGTPFTFFRETGAGAGNFYDTSSYRTLRSGTCYAVEITVHSTNLGNYPEEQHRVQFDNAKVQTLLLGVFESLEFLN
jgi:hypothetical protein